MENSTIQEGLLNQIAPYFTGTAYQQGKKVTISLADFRQKWLMLFFYGGDFTFV